MQFSYKTPKPKKCNSFFAVRARCKKNHKNERGLEPEKGFQTSLVALFLVCETKEKARPV